MNPEVPLRSIRVVLCRPSHPGNIGAAARAMKTMGVSRLYLVQPKIFPDPEADARATGAVDILKAAKVVDQLPDALAGCTLALAMSARQRDLGPPAGMPRSAAVRLLQAARDGEVALVFGNETTGLSNEELGFCHEAVTIPTNPEFSSLNLGAAVQLMCYECRMAAYEERPPLDTAGATPCQSPVATHDEVEGFLAHLLSVITRTGFYNPEQPGRLLPKLRRLFAKARLEREEVNILRGILASTQEPTAHGVKHR